MTDTVLSQAVASYDYKLFSYKTPPELRGALSARKPVVIVGAGPVGLALRHRSALHDVSVVVLVDADVVSVGSRAIRRAKPTLEIFDRLGVGQRVVDKGVTLECRPRVPWRQRALQLRSAAGATPPMSQFL